MAAERPEGHIAIADRVAGFPPGIQRLQVAYAARLNTRPALIVKPKLVDNARCWPAPGQALAKLGSLPVEPGPILRKCCGHRHRGDGGRGTSEQQNEVDPDPTRWRERGRNGRARLAKHIHRRHMACDDPHFFRRRDPALPRTPSAWNATTDNAKKVLRS